MTFREVLTAGPQPPWLRWVFVIGVVTTIARLLLDSRFGTSGLMYVGLPFLAGLLVYGFTPQPNGLTKTARAARHVRSSVIVMLASSAILFEGMICVLFALPIYMFFAGIVLAVLPPPKAGAAERDRIRNTFNGSVLPLIVLALSLEGTHPALTVERDNSVTRTRIVEASVADIHAKLARPVVLTETRSAFLSIFPLPHTVEAGSLAAGDIHTSHYTYKRWPVGNTHEGTMEVEITSVEPERITTRVLSNDAYFSHYLTVEGTRIDLAPRADGTTEVSLTLDYTRDLDPAWYFGPLQKRAMRESADYLIAQMMVPEGG